MLASGGVSRSGRVRKKSAKLMEMEDWDAFDLNEAPMKSKKKKSEEDFEMERKVAPIKIPKAPTVTATPIKKKSLEDVMPVKSAHEPSYLSVPTNQFTKSVVPGHSSIYSTAQPDDSTSSSSETSETSSEDESDSDDSFEYNHTIQQKSKKPSYQMTPVKSSIDFDSSDQQHSLSGMEGSSDMINVDDSEEDTRDSLLVIAEDDKQSKKSAVKRPPAKPKVVRPRKGKTPDDADFEETLKKKKTPAAKLKKPVKEKPSRPMTAYMLWCQENRKKIVAENPGTDFAYISKKLGETWQSLPDKEKMIWKRKAKNPIKKGSTLISTGRPGTQPAPKLPATKPVVQEDPNKSLAIEGPKTLGTGPIDVAAHLKLLGESLSIIGQRLTEHEGQIAVSGSLSVLLDSTLCALGPLLCLTSQASELNGCSPECLAKILNNIAYIMPGL